MSAAGDGQGAVAEGLVILPELGSQMTSVRVLNELRTVRPVAAATGAREFCDRFDEAAHLLAPVSA